MKDNPVTFFQEMKIRLKIPFEPISPSFFGYLFGMVILYGGLGIWFTIFQNISSEAALKVIPPSIGTYFVALWATSFYDLTVSINLLNKKAFHIYSLIGFGVMFFLLWQVHRVDGNPYFWSIIGSLLSLFLWFVVNVDNEKFYETYDQRIRDESKKIHGETWGGNE